MIKRMHVKTILCSLIVIVCLCQGGAQSQQLSDNQPKKIDVGREDPFSQLPKTKKPSFLQAVFKTTSIEGQAPELFAETVMLKFLSAKNVKAALDNLSSEYGSIATDAQSNSLIICDTKANLEKIINEIRNADKTPQQIMVEMVIVDVQLNDDSEIGVNWDLLSHEDYDIAFRQSVGFTSRLGSTIKSAANLGNATAYVTTGTGSDFTILSGTVRNVIHMLQQKKDVEILASPRVMVVSGKTASIEAIEETPYTEQSETSGGGSLTSTEFKDVGVKLDITATLTDEKLIYLTVSAEQKVETGTSNGVPVVDARTAKTSLLLEDGQVVIMGGLRRKEIKRQTEQLPILGDIPLIGLLFKSTNDVENNSELIVFISPHIYKGEPVSEEEMAKFKEISERPMLSLPSEKDKND